MNRKTAIFIACCLAIFATQIGAARGAETQALRFLNGDVLLGNLESIDESKSVVWRRDDVAEPMQFFATNISEIKFSGAKKIQSLSNNVCRVHLRNGDALEGRLLQLDAERVTLETAFAGKMNFLRTFIETIESLPGEGQFIFGGPTGLDGWTIGKVTVGNADDSGQWQYTNGAFYASRSASIARDLKLPDVARIEFDLAWKSSLQAAIALYTSYMQPVNLANKENEPQFGGFYSLQLNSFIATMMPVKQNEPLSYLGQVSVPAFSRKNQAHVEILANKARASIALLVNGDLVKEWIDPSGFAGTGTGMRFVHQGAGAIKLSNLRISEWNGKIEEKKTNAPAITEDVARFINGDRISGTLENFRDDQITFKTAERKLRIPLRRVSEVQFPEKKTVAEKEAAPVRAYFVGGNRVTFHLERWSEQGIVGTSAGFGRATFAPNVFERLEFHPSDATNQVMELDERE
jgi:hypothetical protein